MVEIKKDLGENRKNAQTLRTNIKALELRTNDRISDINKQITEDLLNLDKDMKRVKTSDETETKFFNQQIFSLISDKTKLQQNVVTLSQRMDTCEGDIGLSYK